jgi:cell division protein FtsW (lipid II flippase)
MHITKIFIFFQFLFLFHLASITEAYIGPGLGLGTIGVVLSVVAANILVLLALFWYPFKRFVKWIRKSNNSDEKNTDKKEL